MKARNVLTIFFKELRDTLRDWRALVSMLVVPTVIMPLLTLGFGALSMKVVEKTRGEKAPIMILGGADAPRLRAALAKHDGFEIVAPASDYAERIRDKKLRAAVEIAPGFDTAIAEGKRGAITLYTHDGELRSGFATDALEKFFREHRDKLMRERLAERGLTPEFLRPFEVKRKNVAPPERVGGGSFGGLVPYLLIILCFTGAMYPAIDLTAGEKERGTMETILCSPAARGEIVLGKFLLVLASSLTTVACAVVSFGMMVMIGAATWLRSGVAAVASAAAQGGEALPTVSLPGVAAVLVLMLPLAVLFSALLMTIALFAKSHKEAQTYVSPLILLALMPAIAAVLPGVELSHALALVPVLNVALVSKELVAGLFPAGPFALIFVSSCVYAAAALALATRMFRREDVIFRS
jgi:sodium transport system permease protein